MSFKRNYYNELLASINENSIILTPNRRLSAVLNREYGEQQRRLGKVVWPQIEILPMTSWFIKLWNDFANSNLSEQRLLLNTIQENYLWESIITKSRQSEILLQISETADMAKSAYDLIKQWQINLLNPLFESSPDYRALQEWIDQFQIICDKNGWINGAKLPETICDLIDQNQIHLKKNIYLFGFNERSPQLDYLGCVCQKKGIHFHCSSIPSIKATCQRVHFKTEEDEIFNMARYAKKRLNENKTATIACIIPSLDQIRDRVIRIFDQIFDSDNHQYNISAGKPLNQYPIIRIALQLLSLHQSEVKIELMHTLLTSPFLAFSDKERIKRARFDSWLRKKNISTINLSTHITDKNSMLLVTCPKLGNCLTLFYETLSKYNGYHSYSNWAMILTELLICLGWPGERSLNSHEYQVVDSWQKTLIELTKLDHVASPATIAQAVLSLKKIVSKTIFQPQSPETPIQILGVLEAAYQVHDEMWVAGMNDLAWPERQKPHPLIPKSLQRELNMPHASSEREYEYCKQLIDIFKASSKHIIFSYADTQTDIKTEASPLIRDIPESDIDELSLAENQSPSELIFASKQIEYLRDDQAPSCQSNENFRGGVKSIQQQALCPFKAFSECRLSAIDIDNMTPGLRAIDRGNLTHKVLELLGKQIKNHQILNSLSADQINEIIARSIHDAFIQSNFLQNYKDRYLNLEKNRLHQLLKNWLEIEKQRPPFKIIAAETETQIQLNQLSLTVRIDRIDELSNGKKLIIDYKTGKKNEVNNWFDVRPEEVQLPLYSLVDPDATIGIAFAQLMPSAQTYKGISQSSIGITGIKPITDVAKALDSWEEQIEFWKKTFTQLSDDFYNGKAEVHPKSKQICNWCDLKPLCRINEEDNYPEYADSTNPCQSSKDAARWEQRDKHLGKLI